MLWYLATPYSKYPLGLQAAFEAAALSAAHFVATGHKVFSPVAHSHPLATLGGLAPRDHGLWMALDLAMMPACCGVIVVMMDGWRDSIGVNQEIEWFLSKGKRAVYVSWPRMEVVDVRTRRA